jgi:hypothetical protein
MNVIKLADNVLMVLIPAAMSPTFQVELSQLLVNPERPLIS